MANCTKRCKNNHKAAKCKQNNHKPTLNDNKCRICKISKHIQSDTPAAAKWLQNVQNSHKCHETNYHKIYNICTKPPSEILRPQKPAKCQPKPMKCQVTRKTYKWTLCSDHKPLKIYIYMKISQKQETRAQKGKWLLKYTKRDQKLHNNQKQTTEPHERNSWIHRIVSLKLCVVTKSSFEYFCHFFRFLWQLFSGLNLQHFVLE